MLKIWKKKTNKQKQKQNKKKHSLEFSTVKLAFV